MEVGVGFLLVNATSIKTVVFMLGISSLSGGLLLAHEGIRWWRQVANQLNLGNLVNGPSADEIGWIVASILLLLPGLLTDILAIVILFSPLRRYVGRRLERLMTD